MPSVSGVRVGDEGEKDEDEEEVAETVADE